VEGKRSKETGRRPFHVRWGGRQHQTRSEQVGKKERNESEWSLGKIRVAVMGA